MTRCLAAFPIFLFLVWPSFAQNGSGKETVSSGPSAYTTVSLEASPISVSFEKPAGPPPPPTAFVYPIPFPGSPGARNAGGWKIDSRGFTAEAGSSPRPSLSVGGNKKSGELLLELPPGANAVMTRNVRDDRDAWGEGKLLRARMFLPAGASFDTSVQLVARHGQWGGFTTLPARTLEPGKWTALYWRLGAQRSDWVSMAGAVEWNDTMRRRLTRVGFRFFQKPAADSSPSKDRPSKRKPKGNPKNAGSDKPVSIRIKDIVIEGINAPPPLLKILTAAPARKESGPRQVDRGKRFEVTFDLSRTYDNPYDPDLVAVDVDYFLPSGTSLTLPAFYFQDYLRKRLRNGDELCEPRGRATWKARFTPRESGRHAYRIRVKDYRGDTFQTRKRNFDVRDAPFRGFVRLDPEDGRYMSFEDGSFFYPVGLIVRCPYDVRCTYHYEFEPKPGQGSYVYDRVLPRMADAGINFTRIWMSAWWLSLEWNPGVRKDYEGLGRYSQLSAWRLDHILDMAEDLGIYVNLTLQNHGQFSKRIDQEWDDNPYNSDNGGPIGSPEFFWTNETCREYVRKRQRYLVARWASSPAVAWWEMSNEINLVHKYKSEMLSDWHRDMARHLRSVDPYEHIITTHYIGQGFDPKMFHLPEMEIVQANGYEFDMLRSIPNMMRKFQKSSPDKPCYINEYGTGTTRAALRNNLHAGLWASTVYPFCGTALFWYFQYVDGADEYYQYEALSQFLEGEDFRNSGLKETRLAAVAMPVEEDVSAEKADVAENANANANKRKKPEKKPVEVIAMQNNRAALLWIYDRRVYRDVKAPVARRVGPVRVTVGGLDPGLYKIEFWDTWKGGKLEETTVSLDHPEDVLEFTTPAFKRDVACKIKPFEEGAGNRVHLEPVVDRIGALAEF